MNNTYTSVVTPNVALLVFVGVLIIALLISGFTNPNHYDGTRTKIFISCLAGLGIFVTFLFYYSIVTLQQSQQRYDIIALTNTLSTSLMKGIVDQINVNSQKIPNFILSLFPLIDCPRPLVDDEHTVDNCLLKFKISYKIFYLWQDLILSLPFIDIDPLSYLSNFLQKANSKELYKQWLLCKFDFNQKTQHFGDLLFKYSLSVNCQTADTYLTLANNVLKDPVYKALIL